MKHLILFLALTLSISVFAQAPQAISYQAVIRSASGTVITNQNVGIQFTIRQGSTSGTIVYQETHATTTNAFGTVALEIGRGTAVVGNFSIIAWGNGTYFLEMGLDTTAGSSYISLSTTQFLSVPYALHAASTGANCIVPVALADMTFNNEVINTANREYGAVFTFSAGLFDRLISGNVSVKISVNGIPTRFGSIVGMEKSNPIIGAVLPMLRWEMLLLSNFSSKAQLAY